MLMSVEITSKSVETSSRFSGFALYGLQILLASGFLLAGVPKLLGDPNMVATFEKVGAGQWFRYLTGTLEVLGAAGLITPIAGLAALGLSIVMIGAMGLHFLILGGSALPAFIFFAMAVTIAYGRRDQTLRVVRYLVS
jgi:putative oxidoreductase